MEITFYGTRGSTPIARENSTIYGGNTTCVRIHSTCLPKGHWLVIDTGSGIVPLSWDFTKEKAKAVSILFSHYHHDHTQGFALSAFPYAQEIAVDLYGPYEHGFGPRDIFLTLMRPPFFPVHFGEIGSHINCHNIEFPNSTILLVHPIGGLKVLTRESFERLLEKGKQLPFQGTQKFDVSECMVMRMHRSNHPEQTISYRFEERPTGKVFVFVTDHENQDGIPQRFFQHLKGADLLVMDCQFTRARYDAVTCGWGHATPDYVVHVAQKVGAKSLGITHHDPPSDDDFINNNILIPARRHASSVSAAPLSIFACRDYMKIELS
ncbi:MAG: hypothetical protein A3B74_04370 [Candidatus Kerfeldbacteria bacterium RIFCSPHIGHO2_02_FULL_42_14]|uniref:Metallo-beta-lactamase domain-containing protein n=1 Tax=Candidatus Kerfeldbacteria bacterium RIFCSPHIGHO2_02_FULL_42_14 TaxID=1798540 RepID=A0A1G2ANV1_9BACT|nr:MAG: hypothetical protein A3B74_04370 [Candidatus Kerfeldbacteria bacterium RIFCSPHIGHO2_02_FULL_42_14]OGY80829.1 MAG: hypothetical protein A3E60_01450 [Candidatus Kerfeldbacteria bacterium RIFCSPHIGHO2_12_FULL_42_13]OGY85001.1 MAG: hypothetical protein A3I91_00785 [Candidatus Kerfeldbacteria bacterium RIFCSPLOWO2_02_FULL_42_19]OGY86909.1 MAG: hypothetical protein A3G01_04500 [Candidatus Kerfeldbacteria bacterium RIFCSPLOWO2_12_FULL_43_9]